MNVLRESKGRAATPLRPRRVVSTHATDPDQGRRFSRGRPSRPDLVPAESRTAPQNLSTVWSDDQTTLSFTTLIGPEGQRVLIGTDIPIRFFKRLTKYTTEQVVWRDAATGDELARSDEFPKMSAGILVTPGYAGLQYFLTADGHIIALQVDPSGSG